MSRLKNPQGQIPNGLKYLEPLTGWDSMKVLGSHPSKDRLTDALMQHRLANPRYKGKWRTDRPGVEADVVNYNVKLCIANGWTDYITDDAPFVPPKWTPPLRLAGAVAGVKQSSAGIKLVIEWLGSDLKPEPVAIANQRAAICAVCPNNEEGGFWEKIGALAAAQVKDLMEVRQDMSLKTDYDDKLKSCSACLCWNPLKVFSPRELVQKNTSPEVRAKLHPSCWVLKEAISKP